MRYELPSCAGGRYDYVGRSRRTDHSSIRSTGVVAIDYREVTEFRENASPSSDSKLKIAENNSNSGLRTEPIAWTMSDGSHMSGSDRTQTPTPFPPGDTERDDAPIER